ncbi:Isochorismatase-like protein [Roridomyces roridus]|uniref:Isochorismatase-like protein n=1 Tax=Roridomyces roridus TaxID=1738132 RepID=A0AAD7BE46_9AGAR|nr:Isochorismatase-like protein [Roridomyces roridus]
MPRTLLVLGYQAGFVAAPPMGIPSASIVTANIDLVLTSARQAPPDSIRIIHVRNTGDPGDPDAQGTPTRELVHPPLPGELVLDKEKSNAFTGTELAELITPDEEIVVVGLLSDYSVKHTCRGALERGNTVILIRGAHGTYDHLEIGEGGRFTPAARISARVEEELDEAGVMILDMKYLPDIFEGR